MRLYLLVSAMVLAIACHDDPPVVYPTIAPFDPSTLALGPGDKLELTIFYGNKESKATYSLDASGQLVFCPWPEPGLMLLRGLTSA